MKRFHFPFDYKPKVSLQDTVVYGNIFKQKILNFFYEQYKAIELDPALVVANKDSVLAYRNDDRFVSFDNKANNLISIFNNSQDNYLTMASIWFKRKNFFTYSPSIRRDIKLTNTSSMINWLINLELAMPEDSLNIDYFVQFGKNLINKLMDIVKSEELSKIFEPDKKKTNLYDWKVVQAQKIEDGYPVLTLQQGVNHLCSTNKAVVIQNNFKKLKSNKSIEQYIATSQDLDCSCGFYVFDENNNVGLNLINIYKRPSGNKSYEQLKTSNPIELDNQLYDQKLFDETRPTNMSVSINFTNLLYYLLDKVHLAEVVSSVWTDDFIEFVKTEKIDIL